MNLVFDCKEIRHSAHRYNTLGDYWLSKGTMVIRASRMSHPAYTLAIMVHEMVEFLLCRLHGINEKRITAFDKKHEEERRVGLRHFDEEPGDAMDAPYRAEHQAATHVERAVIAAFDLKWEDYECECVSLFDERKEM